MTNALSELFSGSAFAETLGWTPAMLALQAISGLLIAVAYLIIPATIWRLLRRRRDLDRDARRVAGVFIVFIVAAAAFHIASVAALWLPVYGLQGTLKAVTAIAALATAVAFRQRIPQLLGLPSPRDMARANLALAQTNASLETTVAWRTHELERVSQRFEQALSCSDITVYTQDADLRFTWIHNPRLGLTAADVIGRRTADFLRPEATDESLPLKLRALESGLTVSDTIAIATPSEGTLYMDMTVSPTIDQEGEIDGVLCTVVDVTEKRLFEVRLASMAAELATASHRFELALDNSGISVFEQTPDLRYTYMYNPPAGTEPEDYLDRIDTEIFPERELRKILPPKRRVLANGGRETVEIEVDVGGAVRFFVLTLEARTDAGGEVKGIVGSALDLTERRRDEKRMRLMLRELTHRSKNLLAVIQAMARKTASLSDDMDGFIADFSSRLRAMAAAHDLLVSQSWQGADLSELLRASVAQTIAPDARQVRMEGPVLMLAPDTAQNLGLAFHELATNASKYGALASDTGELNVSWTCVDEHVRIVWRERGGPPVTQPERRGFGRVLLERLVGATLNGSVTLDFQPEGLVCEIEFPENGLDGT